MLEPLLTIDSRDAWGLHILEISHEITPLPCTSSARIDMISFCSKSESSQSASSCVMGRRALDIPKKWNRIFQYSTIRIAAACNGERFNDSQELLVQGNISLANGIVTNVAHPHQHRSALASKSLPLVIPFPQVGAYATELGGSQSLLLERSCLMLRWSIKLPRSGCIQHYERLFPHRYHHKRHCGF